MNRTLVLTITLFICACANTVQIRTIVQPVMTLMPCSSSDCDGDGLEDSLEEALAIKYAPVVYHPISEPNLPLSVEWFLEQSHLGFYDNDCSPDLIQDIRVRGTSDNLTVQALDQSCDTQATVTSSGSWDRSKSRTFFLYDLHNDARKGEKDSTKWTTYYHAYPNEEGGVTLQYWRSYAYDNGRHLLGSVYLGGHGGDWEGIHVVLDSDYGPHLLRILGHTNIETHDWSSKEFEKEGLHPVIFSELGGHTSSINVDHTGIRQETWNNLSNLGEKTKPFHRFLSYSGLWGSRGIISATSGYWGPAFNETDMKDDPEEFHPAWCAGMKTTMRERSTNGVSECYTHKK